MKNLKSIVQIFVGIFLLSAPAHLLASEAAGKTILARGDVKASNDDKTRKLKRRSPIYNVDTIITGAKSRAQIRMSDGGMLALQENTHLEIAKYEYDAEANKGSAVMSLISGGIRTVTGKLKSENGDYKLETPVGSIGIRGTHYEIEIINGELFIAVWDGAIDISVEVGGTEQEISLGDTEDYAYAKIDENGEVTELLEPPENFNQGHSSDYNESENEEESEDETASNGEGENEDSSGESNNNEESEGQNANNTEEGSEEENNETADENSETENEEQTANADDSEGENQGSGDGDDSNGEETAENANTENDNTLGTSEDDSEETEITNNTNEPNPLGESSGEEDNLDENTEVASSEEEGQQDEEILEIIKLGEKTEVVIVDADTENNNEDVFDDEDDKILEDASKENTLDDVSTTDDVFSFIENRTGTANFSLDTDDIANKNINSMSMTVNFTTRVISDGELLLGTDNDIWYAVFDGKFDSSEIDMDINAASHNDIKADGDISGTFTNKGENITGEFELWEEQNREINTKGTYVLGENK